ncbi:hypothetical protein CTI12_AA563020 [Artemisia annua]|uniref:Uncharacterized protein n=1 Tax=Artemisia annua TaxID=35608 RepID=A0A2U1KUJ7_ARTAN|nr:hypothetical protein CTI12_AA563020 [Artemisia annua]
MNQSEMEGRGLPTLYPSLSGDPNKVSIRMNDPAINKTYIGKHLCFTQRHLSERTLARLARSKARRKASSKSTVIENFGPAQHVAAQAETGTKRGIIGYSNETSVSENPDPRLRYVHPPQQVHYAFPPPLSFEEAKAAGAVIEAKLAAARKEIQARSARYLAAAPPVPRYWEDPSKKKASEAAATNTEG